MQKDAFGKLLKKFPKPFKTFKNVFLISPFLIWCTVKLSCFFSKVEIHRTVLLSHTPDGFLNLFGTSRTSSPTNGRKPMKFF